MEKEVLSQLVKSTSLNEQSIKNTVELLNKGATIPFISRYRKEMTGSLDEVEVGLIKTELERINDLVKRKLYVITTIKEQGKLTPSLQSKIENCWDEIVLEDIYLPYKKKKKTKATIAKEKGLEPLAKTITDQTNIDIQREASKYLNEEVVDIEEALQGARFIIAEWVSENAQARDIIRQLFSTTARLVSKVVKKKKVEAAKYTDYFEYTERLSKCPSHRLLAVYRGESEGFLKVKVEIESEEAEYKLNRLFVSGHHDSAEQVREAIMDCLKRLILPSIENEFRKSSKEKADLEAIEVFTENLKQLLLASPIGTKKVLAIDPGFRSGCKVVCLDESGELQHNTTIYPHPPQQKKHDSEETIKHLVDHYNIEAIAIGNGTAGKETMSLLNKTSFRRKPTIYLVNESGASIYSASAIAREEFPDQDLTVRGAISIGRRLMDPLAELVKIDAKSIGVGQYQHDVNQSKLKQSLDRVVESCVNAVGVNLNTASQHLLTYISGLGPGLAQNIVDYRKEVGGFKTRSELKKVARMGSKAYEQAAGFLRIKDGDNPLDNTGVHPESYAIVKTIAKNKGKKIEDLMNDSSLKDQVKLSEYITDKIGLPTLKDILKELEKPGLDPRGEATVFHFTEGIESMSDLKEGMIISGLINNITKFGAFVDVGIKESGLIHISQITNRFIKDPAEVLKLNQQVKVKVMSIDIDRKRIGLSMKEV